VRSHSRRMLTAPPFPTGRIARGADAGPDPADAGPDPADAADAADSSDPPDGNTRPGESGL